MRYDAVIIGGGFFGCRIALHLRQYSKKILILEKEADFLQHASLNNQARVHNGYHYPRSLLTALRSRVSLPVFVADYPDCIDDSFEKFYLVGRQFSKVSAAQFEQFCQRIGAELEPAPSHIADMFNGDLIESVYRAKEFAFDAVKLKKRLLEQLAEANIDHQTGAEVQSVSPDGDGVRVLYRQNGQEKEVSATNVYNCTYAHINEINRASGLPTIPLKHELAELALVDVPKELKHIGVTVMCGPFFSLMPFPSRSLHSLSHVRYTPHTEWFDKDGEEYRDGYKYIEDHRPRSAFDKMIADAKRYLPIAAKCTYKDSIWEDKTVLPQSEGDDSRPILFRANHGIPGYTCIMGGKLDNVYDVLKELDKVYA